MELLVKVVNDFKLKTIFAKSSILDASQVLSLPLTTLNQMFLTNNKRAISRFYGTVALTTQNFTCLKSTIETLKTLKQDVKYV